MRKKIILLVICFMSGFNLIAQNTYYDAIRLANIQKRYRLSNLPGTNDTVYKVLANYIPVSIITGKDSVDRESINKFFNKTSTGDPNPFIEINVGKKSGSKISSKLGSVLASTGSLDVTNIADGLAKFIVARTKQELSIAFFERFSDEIKKNDQLKILFPATSKALIVIGQEIYNYSGYLVLLRESFQKDLALLLPNIGKLIDDKCMNDLFKNCPEIRTILSDALYIAVQFSEGINPGEIFHNYTSEKAEIESLKKLNPNLFPSLQMLDLFSQSLRSKQTDQYWVSPDSLKLLYDNTTFQIYMGLIYQQALNSKIKIVFKDSNGKDTSFVGILKEVQSRINVVKPYITELISKGKSIDYYFSVIKEKQKLGKDKPSYQDYFSLYDASLNFLEYIVNVPSSVPFPILKKDNVLDEYFGIARSFGSIYVDIYEKQYTSAIVEFSSVFSILIVPRIDSIEKEIEQVEKQLSNASADQKKKLESLKKELESQIKALKQLQLTGLQILKYGNFIALVAQAENSDEVQKAIEAIALPAGSARIKRESSFNVSINAYCGLFYGEEKIKGINNWEWNSYGVSAPIGISISKNGNLIPFAGVFFSKGHSSHSIFLSVVDIGALASFRFVDDSTNSVPKVELKDIISPGIFYSLGICKSPISINAGWQIGPLLREVTAQANSYSKSYSRFSISICVDIPVLNLYTKPRK